MPSPQGVKVKLDRVRFLRYTNRSLVMLERESGSTAIELMKRVSAGSMESVNQLIWAGLLHAEPGLEVDDVLDRVDMHRFQEIAEAVSEALTQSLGSENGSAEGKAGAAAGKS